MSINPLNINNLTPLNQAIEANQIELAAAEQKTKIIRNAAIISAIATATLLSMTLIGSTIGLGLGLGYLLVSLLAAAFNQRAAAAPSFPKWLGAAGIASAGFAILSVGLSVYEWRLSKNLAKLKEQNNNLILLQEGLSNKEFAQALKSHLGGNLSPDQQNQAAKEYNLWKQSSFLRNSRGRLQPQF